MADGDLKKKPPEAVKSSNLMLVDQSGHQSWPRLPATGYGQHSAKPNNAHRPAEGSGAGDAQVGQAKVGRPFDFAESDRVGGPGRDEVERDHSHVEDLFVAGAAAVSPWRAIEWHPWSRQRQFSLLELQIRTSTDEFPAPPLIATADGQFCAWHLVDALSASEAARSCVKLCHSTRYLR